MKVLTIERPGEPLLVYDLDNGAIRYAANEMISPLEELGKSALVDRAKSVVEKVEAAIQIRYDWQHDKHEDPMTREGTKKLDGRIDRMITSMRDTANTCMTLVDGCERKELAEEFIDGLFSAGVAPITSSTYTEQHADVDALIDRLRGEYATHVEALNLELHVDQLAEMNAEFGERLNSDDDNVEYDEVEAASVETEDEFHRLLIETMAEFSEDMETLNRVLDPVLEQSERARRHLKRRGSMPDVDPETGEPIDESDSGPGGPADGGSPTDEGDSDNPTPDEESEPSDGDGQND